MTDGDGGLVTFGETLGLLVAEDIGPLSLARGMRLSMGGAESRTSRSAWHASVCGPPGSGASATTRSAT